MSSNYGINVKTSATGARAIFTDSKSVLAVVGSDSSLSVGLHFYANPTKAYKDISANSGTLKDAISDLVDTSINMPLILGVFKASTNSNPATAKSEDITSCVSSLQKLLSAESEVAYKPNLIIAPSFSNETSVSAKMNAVATSLKAIGIVDVDGADESTVITKAKTFSTHRLLLCHPKVKNLKGVDRPLSTYIATLICKTDSTWEYGYSDSFSNRPILGIKGLSRDIEYIAGEDCEADRLRSAGVTTVIAPLTAWGGESTNSDSAWKSLHTVRIFDKVSEATLKGMKWAIDRRSVDVLKSAKDSQEEFMRSLKGNGVNIGFSVVWDKDKNTNTTAEQGKFYMSVSFQEVPLVKQLTVEFNRVTTYGSSLIKQVT